MLTTERGRIRAFQAYASSFVLIVQLLLIHAALKLTNGRLIYTLDDPYIHLAVAEAILRGEYGINPGEFASPSSSILYPFLLALGLAIGLGELTPLVLSAPFTIAATWMLTGFAWRTLNQTAEYVSVPSAILLGPAIGLAINAAALPMTGMEHAIHVFATVLALTGLHTLTLEPRNRRALASVVIGTLLCASIRFEGLALAMAMIGGLLALGFRRPAIATGVGILAILGGYMLTMKALGLPVFPSSVMTKSPIAAHAGDGNTMGMIKALVANVWAALNERWGRLFSLVSAMLLAAVLFERSEGQRRKIVLLVVFFILSAHIATGKYGWFGRYEVYAVAAMLVGLFLLTPCLARPALLWTVAPLLGLVIGAPYLKTTLQTPAASANIYQQQYQMQRFAQRFFPERVAVNDLGLVAFRNEGFVLDLWGLGSEEARRLSINNQWTPELMREITRRHKVVYAMIYTDWFREVPTEWCRVGDLVTSRVTSASDTVSFFLIRRDREAEMRAALREWSADLPAGSRFHFRNCEALP